jgi:hypothetical protein
VFFVNDNFHLLFDHEEELFLQGISKRLLLRLLALVLDLSLWLRFGLSFYVVCLLLVLLLVGRRCRIILSWFLRLIGDAISHI